MNLPAAAPVAPASAADNAGPVIRDSNSSLARRLMLRNLQQYRHVVTEQPRFAFYALAFASRGAAIETLKSAWRRADPPEMFVCAAVVGQASEPLYLDTNDNGHGVPGDVLTFHYLVHCALDGVEEKLAAPRRGLQQEGDLFMGLLYSTEDFHVYGHMTNTRIKLITVVDDEGVKEDDVRSVLRQIHGAYIDVVSNPFHEAGQPLTSLRFDHKVKAILDSANGLAQPE